MEVVTKAMTFVSYPDCLRRVNTPICKEFMQELRNKVFTPWDSGIKQITLSVVVVWTHLSGCIYLKMYQMCSFIGSDMSNCFIPNYLYI